MFDGQMYADIEENIRHDSLFMWGNSWNLPGIMRMCQKSGDFWKKVTETRKLRTILSPLFYLNDFTIFLSEFISYPYFFIWAIPCLQEYKASANEAAPVHDKGSQPLTVQFHLDILEKLQLGTHLSIHC